ncbi:MAG TPA: HI0074 family nucleotidyltransferase substrate-binding subunit [Alphaproteobacteria bacterium]|nr:HI0074 family nucleotidyltransferase substrate-binding subunit [Alphaproteobacteria bacterium]
MEKLHYQFLEKLKSLDFIEEIWLFGSRARGDYHERSDIDLAIVCPKATGFDWMKITDIIEDADTLLKIDCIRFDTLQNQVKLRNNILKFKKVIYIKGKMMEEIYWKDYFHTLGQAIDRLKDVLNNPDIQGVDYMQDAAIQRFEFVTELFWKVLKKVLAYEKVEATTPRDVLKKSYQFKLIDDEDIWLAILTDRNLTSHVYKEEEAKKVFKNIIKYAPVFEKTYKFLKEKYRL